MLLWSKKLKNLLSLMMLFLASLSFTEAHAVSPNEVQAQKIRESHVPRYQLQDCFIGIRLKRQLTENDIIMDSHFINWLIENEPELAAFFRFDVQWTKNNHLPVITMLYARKCDQLREILVRYKDRYDQDFWGPFVEPYELFVPLWSDISSENMWIPADHFRDRK